MFDSYQSVPMNHLIIINYSHGDEFFSRDIIKEGTI
jgi:hypothetical protein